MRYVYCILSGWKKRDPRNPRNPRLKNYLYAEGKPCSSATLVNYHFFVINRSIPFV